MDVEARTTAIPNILSVPIVARSGIDSDIVCACSGITRSEIAGVVTRMQAAGEAITKGKVFRALGHRPNCGTCFGELTAMLPDQSDAPQTEVPILF